MGYETEVKVALTSMEYARLKELLDHECKFVESLVQHDTYFNHPCRDFAETDEALRVRRTLDRCILTYKGPRRSESGVKTRLELKASVTAGCGELLEMLERLGFTHVATVVKNRRKYACPCGLKVVLDDVEGLGLFVEVEATGEGAGAVARVRRFLEKAGVRGRVVEETYLELLLSKRGFQADSGEWS